MVDSIALSALNSSGVSVTIRRLSTANVPSVAMLSNPDMLDLFADAQVDNILNSVLSESGVNLVSEQTFL